MPVRDRLTALARKQAHRARAELECLERRALLSRGEASVSGALADAQVEATASNQVVQLYKQSLHQHPLMQTIVNGRVKKVPMFYALFTGLRRPDVDVVGANGQFYSGLGFVFTGLTLGSINSSQRSNFVFGVTRGSASPPGPFPDRPMIDFDAEVVVATNSNGWTGTVELLNSRGKVTSTTSLVNTAVIFSNNQVQVIVPGAIAADKSARDRSSPRAVLVCVLGRRLASRAQAHRRLCPRVCSHARRGDESRRIVAALDLRPLPPPRGEPGVVVRSAADPAAGPVPGHLNQPFPRMRARPGDEAVQRGLEP